MATNTTYPATDATNTTRPSQSIKGHQELQKYIEEMNELFCGIQRRFQDDLVSPMAKVEEPYFIPTTSSRSRLNFRAELCAMSHRTYTHNNSLCDLGVINAEEDVRKCLHQLDELRKMLVNNKQEKNRMVRWFRRIIRTNCDAAAVVDAAAVANRCWREEEEQEEEEGGQYQERELEYKDPVTLQLLRSIEMVKQHHKTVSKRLLDQIGFTMIVTKRCVLQCQQAMENVVQKIIDHAEKCRAFIAMCFNLAVIEYCATAWWFETQKDPMDHGDYYVSVIETAPSTEKERREIFNEERMLRHRYNAHTLFPVENAPFTHTPSTIQIVVYRPSTIHHQTQIVNTYEFDQELAETILTKDAIQSFETAQKYGFPTMRPGDWVGQWTKSVKRGRDEEEQQYDDDADQYEKHLDQMVSTAFATQPQHTPTPTPMRRRQRREYGSGCGSN
jgi:hypothetical protein